MNNTESIQLEIERTIRFYCRQIRKEKKVSASTMNGLSDLLKSYQDFKSKAGKDDKESYEWMTG